MLKFDREENNKKFAFFESASEGVLSESLFKEEKGNSIRKKNQCIKEEEVRFELSRQFDTRARSRDKSTFRAIT